MAKFVIASGAAPHLRLDASGREFSGTLPPMMFDSHDDARDYVLAHTEHAPLDGLRAEVIEDSELSA
ncbi:hypothetical protein MLD63_00230 (plasmid) [Paracoccus sp. TK19116]|uniref:Uncharacterized protein n=1 Tax=Paracoccus albicereus TaxID=2922394 RepID=A0ABT1MKM5_9RHOB|nr:hypothetical protein [Paracoccus albicereus]MCQ0968865.1 hypothetical protein [Paracoccus albicereus]